MKLSLQVPLIAGFITCQSNLVVAALDLASLLLRAKLNGGTADD
jgi:hypothetical protein